MVSQMVEMERSYLTAEVFREILASSHATDDLSEDAGARVSLSTIAGNQTAGSCSLRVARALAWHAIVTCVSSSITSIVGWHNP